MPPMTADKAIAAFITSLIAIAGLIGFKTDWATPDVVTAASAIGGALLVAVTTYFVKNKPKV